MSSFKELLIFYRKANGMSQEKLAKKASLRGPFISKLEKGKHIPSKETVKQIAIALELTDPETADLLGSLDA